MVAGDQNDQFAAAILGFLGNLGTLAPAESAAR
jgi:hypothetical protein